jgi:branched-chain amino acid aminotransferase
MTVERRPVPVEELADFAEVAACGTAVVVTPVWEITRGSDVIKISDEHAVGPHLQKLYDTMQGIQYGVLEDVHGWCHEVKI